MAVSSARVEEINGSLIEVAQSVRHFGAASAEYRIAFANMSLSGRLAHQQLDGISCSSGPERSNHLDRPQAANTFYSIVLHHNGEV